MDLDLRGKVVIVTGASRGIGAAIAKTLAFEDASLVLVARSEEALRSVAATCATPSLVVPADLRITGSADAVVQSALQQFGRIDILINNAGATQRGDFLALRDEDWADGFSLKLFAAVRCCRAAWNVLRQRRGAIVNIAGVGGRTGDAAFTIGGSVNAALMYLTKALADRGVQEGVRVNAVNPGATLTDRLRARVRKFAADHNLDEAEAVRRMALELRVERFSEPEEVAAVVAFLASPRSERCQGAVLDVDGGQTRAL